jgi:7-carboxy-7-deazaguanine synthase
MHIIEIYKSLQGESSYAGLPCVFVRLAGCNLRCVWCDSEYTFTGGHRMTLEEIEQEVSRLSPNGSLVEITGGEPMLQEREVVPLMEALYAAGYTVLLETLHYLQPHDEVKFVIASRRDYVFARDFTRAHGLTAKVASVIFSPAFRKDASGARDASHCLVDPRELAEWMLEDGIRARLGLQIHKFIWEPSMKGV